MTISRAGCRARTRAVRALTAAVRKEAGRRRPTPRGREDGGDGAGGSGSCGGTPAGAHDAVGGMDAAIVGTQRRAERAAATQGRRDHQSCSPPQRPCPRSGIPGQSARGSRAGREADQCRAALQAVGGHSPKQPNSTGFPSFPTVLRARTGAARASELQTVPGYARVQRDLASLLCSAQTPSPRLPGARSMPRGILLPRLHAPEDARSGCGRPMPAGVAVRWDHLASPEPASLPVRVMGTGEWVGVGGGEGKAR